MHLDLKQIFLKITIAAFALNTLGPVTLSCANNIVLPKPGSMIHLSPAYNPPVLKGVKIHPENPFKFEFVLDCGDTSVGNRHACSESK